MLQRVISTFVYAGLLWLAFADAPAHPAAVSFQMNIAPREQSVEAGRAAVFRLSLRSVENFTGDVSFHLSALPAGVSAVFSPATLTLEPNQEAAAELTVLTAANAAPGRYNLILTTINRELSLSEAIALEIRSLPPPTPTPTPTPAPTPTPTPTPTPRPDFLLAVAPQELAIRQGEEGVCTVTATGSGQFPQEITLSLSNAPAGVTATFTPAVLRLADAQPVAASLRLAVGPTVPRRPWFLTVNGVSGEVRRSADLTLIVGGEDPPGWRSIGPPGRVVNALALHPGGALLYAGTDDGVYLRTAPGSDWRRSNDGLDDLFIRSLALNPQNPNIVYAGTSDGVYVTVNGGLVWQQTSLRRRQITALTLDPRNPAVVYAGTFEGVFRSGNGGATWAEAGLSGLSVLAFTADAGAQPPTLYAGTTDGVYQAALGAGTTTEPVVWTKTAAGLDNVAIRALALSTAGTPADRKTIYAGGFTGLYRLVGEARVWEKANTDDRGVLCLAAMPVVGGVVYAGTDGGGVLQSSDGGLTWAVFGSGLLNPYILSLLTDATGRQLYAGASGSGVFVY